MERVAVHTSRLTLRNLREPDLEAVAGYRCDASTLRYIGEPMSREEVATHIARHRDGWSRLDGEALHLAVELRREGVLIGEVMLRHLSPQHWQAEFGAALSARWRGHGYGIEALVGLFRYAFEDLCLHRLFGYTDVDNPDTARVSDTLGLHREGTLRHNARRCGRWRDEYLVSLLAHEWPALRHRCRNLLDSTEQRDAL